MEKIGEASRSSTAYVGQATGRNTHAHGRAEDASTQIGDTVSAELSVGVGRAQRSVPALKVLDDAGRDQDIHGRDERQPQGGRQDVGDVIGRPGEAGKRWHLEGDVSQQALVRPRAA